MVEEIADVAVRRFLDPVAVDRVVEARRRLALARAVALQELCQVRRVQPAPPVQTEPMEPTEPTAPTVRMARTGPTELTAQTAPRYGLSKSSCLTTPWQTETVSRSVATRLTTWPALTGLITDTKLALQDKQPSSRLFHAYSMPIRAYGNGPLQCTSVGSL